MNDVRPNAGRQARLDRSRLELSGSDEVQGGIVAITHVWQTRLFAHNVDLNRLTYLWKMLTLL